MVRLTLATGNASPVAGPPHGLVPPGQRVHLGLGVPPDPVEEMVEVHGVEGEVYLPYCHAKCERCRRDVDGSN